VRVSPDDYGRLIGREGRTIKAIRSLLYVSVKKTASVITWISKRIKSSEYTL
jgi:predicted RNA-binding protein YlqC (UPF0109 family)